MPPASTTPTIDLDRCRAAGLNADIALVDDVSVRVVLLPSDGNLYVLDVVSPGQPIASDTISTAATPDWTVALLPADDEPGTCMRWDGRRIRHDLVERSLGVNPAAATAIAAMLSTIAEQRS